jgi:SAM-dependent methyltransferase
MLSRLLYKASVLIISRLGLYTLRYVMYVGVLVKVASLLKFRGRLLCLDLGCGDGTITRYLSRICDIVVGLDIKPHTSWYQRGSPNMLYVVADARRPPLRPGSTDLITIISLLEHVPQWGDVIRESGAILKHKGLLVIQLPNLWFLIEPHTKFPLLAYLPGIVKKVIAQGTGYSDLQFDCKVDNVVEMLKHSNFRILGVYSYYHGLNPRILRKLIPPPAYFIVAVKASKYAH